MKLNLSIIEHELGECVISSKLESETRFRIWCVREADGKEYDEGILYATKMSTFLTFRDVPSSAKFMIAHDCEFDDELIECAHVIVRDLSVNEMMDKVTKIFLNYYEWKDKIFRAIEANVQLKGILKVGYEKIGNPLAICDTSLNCVGLYGSQYVKKYNSVWPIEKSQKSGNLSLNARLKEAGILNKIRTEKEPLVYKLPGDSDEVLHQNIFFQNRRIAYLIVVAANRPLDNYALSVTRKFSDIVSSVLVLSIGLQHESLSDMDLITRRYLNSQMVDSHYQASVFEEYGWDVNDEYCVCQFETVNSKDEYDIMPDIVHFQGLTTHSAIFYYRTGIFMLQNLTRSGLTYEEFETFARGLVNEFNYVCGISGVFRNYEDIKLEERKSLIALLVAKGVKKKNGTNSMMKYDQCILDGVFKKYNEDLDLRMLCRSDIYALYLYDVEHNTEYVDSLYTYLSSGMNYVDTSKKLFIHRNTFIYRLKKILEIIGEDALKEDDSVLEILLSCRAIKKFRESKGQKGDKSNA